MRWTKKGLIIEPTGQFDWMVTHASIPFAERIHGDLYRVYFYGRDKLNRSQPGYIEIDINKPKRITYITEEPVLELGALGTFDDSGVMPSWIVGKDGLKYLYYTGWTQGVTVPFYFYVGLAVSHDGGRHFDRISKGPILERNDCDPYLIASPCILIENGVWRMWYCSSMRWGIEDGELVPYDQIKYAESKDGINWKRKGVGCIDCGCKLARPCVLKERGIYKMWYSVYRSGTYRISYAESGDGIHWESKDNVVGIDVSESGWDSEMIEYAFVFEHKDRKYMLYNGNDYGKTGLGYAIMDVKEN